MDAGQVAVQLVVGLLPAAGVYGLLRLGPERRKLTSEAKVQDATAADLLTGRALSMVQHAEERSLRAETTADRAEARAAAAEVKADKAQRHVTLLRRRVEGLTRHIRDSGGTVPPWDERELAELNTPGAYT